MDYKFETELSLEEIGLYSTMLNEDGANFATAEQLAALSTASVEKVKEFLMSLLRKYTLCLNTRYGKYIFVFDVSDQ